jgi:nucleoside-diphosphate-sugar epimerase
VATELVAAGHEVFGLRRRVELLPPGVRPIAADLADRASLSGLPPATHLVYAASAGARTERAYERAYLTGLTHVLDALGDERLERVVFTSSTAVYGQSDGRWIDETSPTFPTHFSGQILLAAERHLFARPCSAVSLRLSGIYGPGRTRLVRMVHAGRAHAAHDLFANRIHRDDCAGAIAHLLFHPSPEPLYVGTDDDPAPLDEVYAYVASLVGVPYPPATLPDGDAGDAERARSNKRCRNARLRASGYVPRVPSYRDGYPSIVREYLLAPEESEGRRTD